MNEYYFQIEVSEEQVDYANRIVDYSILNHPVTDIFANDPQGKERQREFRFTGSLGEIVFADAYQLPRQTRAFPLFADAQKPYARKSGKAWSVCCFPLYEFGRIYNEV